MKISDLGEGGVIELISKKFHFSYEDATVGIGDDCAVIPVDSKKSLLITTDSLVENIHFLKNMISPKDLGHKSLAVNLSDIAAMGGTAKFAFLSLSLPSNVEIDWCKQFVDGFKELADKYKINLLGGDTTGSKNSIFINVTILGEGQNHQIKLRSNAKVGDFICVTGLLGDSGGGLRAQLAGIRCDSDLDYLIQKNHRPEPHLQQGLWLSQCSEVTAMMDVSDGIHSDITKIMKLSQCGALVRMESLPISPELHRAALSQNWNLFDLATCGGEDYCLLLTVKSAGFRELSENYFECFKHNLTAIGQITDKINVLEYELFGEEFHFDPVEFNHFTDLSGDNCVE